MALPSEIPFQQVIEALSDTEKPFSPRLLYRFSDLNREEIDRLAQAWPYIPAWRRKALMEDIEQLGEEELRLSYEALARLAVEDDDPHVRLPAVRTLWEYEDLKLAALFSGLLSTDPDSGVRAAAASGLGQFIYLGELEELPPEKLHAIEDQLLATINGQDDEAVRRKALEAIGFSSRDEVNALIEQAYYSDDKHWIASALFAMGRSANEIWRPQVLAMLDNPHPVIRKEAVRAAGELEMASVAPRLLEMLDDPDDDTRNAAIWSLSQIGGPHVRATLERLADETEDGEELEYIASALDNLAFTEDMQSLPFFDLPDEKEDDSNESGDDFDEVFDELEDDLSWLEQVDADGDQNFADYDDDDMDDDEDRLA